MIIQVIQQHMAVVEDVLSKHLLWCPRLADVQNTVVDACKKTIVRLNDGRECEVITKINEAEESESVQYMIETKVNRWQVKEEAW